MRKKTHFNVAIHSQRIKAGSRKPNITMRHEKEGITGRDENEPIDTWVGTALRRQGGGKRNQVSGTKVSRFPSKSWERGTSERSNEMSGRQGIGKDLGENRLGGVRGTIEKTANDGEGSTKRMEGGRCDRELLQTGKLSDRIRNR